MKKTGCLHLTYDKDTIRHTQTVGNVICRCPTSALKKVFEHRVCFSWHEQHELSFRGRSIQIESQSLLKHPIVDYTSSARTRRGGSCLRVIHGYTISPFSPIELACAARQPGPCPRALCKAVAVLWSKNMTCHCARPRCNATPSDTLRTAFFTPRAPHFTLALHLNSSHPSCSHLISCLLKCQLSCSWLFSFYLRTWQQNIATFMQPFQSDLQRGVPQLHRTTHTQRHAKCRTPREK